MRKRLMGYVAAAVMSGVALTGCGSSVVEQAAQQQSTQAQTAKEEGDVQKETAEAATLDLTDKVELKINFAVGNKSRTLTYNQESPLTLPDGKVVTAGMLKPMWSYVEDTMNVKISDVTVQDMKTSDMIQTESTSNFTGANIYGGSGIAERLMFYDFLYL